MEDTTGTNCLKFEMLLILHVKCLLSLSQFNQKWNISTHMKIRVTVLDFLYASGGGKANRCVLAVLNPNAPQINSPNLMLFTVVTEISPFNFASDVNK